MNFFRRLFGQGEANTAPTGGAAPAAVPQNGSEPSDKPIQRSAPTRPSIADGVTRPLPQEPVSIRTGNEHLCFGQASDIGMVRTNNQDSAFSFYTTFRSVDDRPDFGLFVVADGMGGHHDGEKASAVTAQTFAAEVINSVYVPLLHGERDQSVPISETLEAAVQKANAAVIESVPDGGTTITSVTIIDDLAYIVHVGDSRIYLITKEGIEQVTRDHSLVQRLIELDQLTPEEAAEHPQRNVLYRALGQSESLEVDTITRRLPPNSRLLLCSDGLWNQVPEHEINAVAMAHADPQEGCERLIALANARGGADNVTTILLYMPG
jgi:serine/threonine protein phosphatase PrpC